MRTSNRALAESNDQPDTSRPETEKMKIFIPTPLRQYAGGHNALEIDAATVAEAMDKPTTINADLRNHLFNAEGKLRTFVNLCLNDEDERYLPAKEVTAVTAADTLSIIPSIAGGCCWRMDRTDRD